VAEITVRVQPRSSQNKIVVNDGEIRVWVTASPTDGQANAAVCELIASKLGIAKSRVVVLRGHTSRDKKVGVSDLDLSEVIQNLADER
jgi:uncharacterized protein (TIGR00251 family)